MSDFGGGDEPNALGGMGVGSLNFSGISEASSQMDELKSSVKGLMDSLRELSNSDHLFRRISEKFTKTTESVKAFVTGVTNASSAASGASKGASGSGTGSGVELYATARQQASAAAGGSGGGSGGSTGGPGMGSSGRAGGFTNTAGAWLGLGSQTSGLELAAALAMTPMRFMRDRLQTNMNVALGASSALGMAQIQTGTSMADMLQALSRNPGGVYGTPSELLNLFQMAPQLGAGYGFGGGAAATGVRGAGMFQGIREAQMLNPGASMESIVGAIGGYAANTRAQQQSIMMTGGAFSMIKAGGGQKSLTEWAESVLKWLQNLSPDPEIRSSGFSAAQLAAQQFPGSNIDAWFEMNGVPQDLRNYWWTYAIGKANKTITPAESKIFGTQSFNVNVAGQGRDSLAYSRLRSTNALTQGEFRLGEGMYGAYQTRENSNRIFNEMFGQTMADVFTNAIQSPILKWIQYLPQTIEDMLFGILERSGPGIQALAGSAGILGMLTGDTGISGIFQGLGGVDPDKDRGGLSEGGEEGGGGGGSSWFSWGDFASAAAVGYGFPGFAIDRVAGSFGDVGDLYGDLGGTGLSGLSPDMKGKLGDMMRANPRLRVTSGLRDTGLQQRLRGKGHSRVSGKPSAHTRGMAADLGPRSEYPWIVANAKKFGLKSGANIGEPWHVGVGDVDIGEDWLDSGQLSELLDHLGNAFKGIGSIGTPEGMVGAMGGIFELLTNLFTGGGEIKTGLRTSAVDYSVFRKALDAKGIPIRRTTGLNPQGGLGYITSAAPGTVGGVPTGSFGPGQLSGSQVARFAYNAGFRGEDLVTAVAIANRESSWDSGAHNPNAGTGDNSYGLWQINMLGNLGPSRREQLGISSNEELFNPVVNARAAYMLYQSGGNTFHHWGGYKGYADDYNTDYTSARAAVREAGLGDIPDYEYMMPTASSSSASGMTFNNTFNISGGSGGTPGLDTRRLVGMMADQLEDEMKKRLVRSS